MCCPFLKHLSLSSCKSITDAAFAASISHTPQPGHSLTSIDISGCQSLSTVAVKYLVGLCGANLTSINLAWTGINCTALLYLAGLNMEKVAKIMCSADAVPTYSAPSASEKKQNLACANLNESCKALYHNQDFSTDGFLDSNREEGTTEDTYGFSESQLNEIEVSKLKDVLTIPCEPSLLQSVEGVLHPQESSEPPEVPCHEELTSDVDFIPTCTYSSSLPEKVTRNAVYEQELTSRDEQLLETENIEVCVHSVEGIVKKAADSETPFCWDVPSKVETLKDSRMKDESLNSVFLPPVQEEALTNGPEAVPLKTEHRIERNSSTLTTTKKSVGELETEEIHQDGLHTESHPVEDQFNCGYAVGVSSFTMECDISSTPLEVLTLPSIPLVKGLELDIPTMPCEEVKAEESTGKCLSMDKEAECEEPGISCKVEEVEKSVLSMEPCIKETDYNINVSPSTIPCLVSETAESSTWSITPRKDEDHSVKTCWEDKTVLPEFETEQDEQSSHFEIFPNIGATAEKSLRDCTLSHSKVIQITDLLQEQLFQPQITSLDITSMSYQSKPLGQACLKIFSQANKCLKNFAVSWSELDDRMLTYILKNEPELEFLSLVCWT